jgi:hypothetical protein
MKKRKKNGNGKIDSKGRTRKCIPKKASNALIIPIHEPADGHSTYLSAFNVKFTSSVFIGNKVRSQGVELKASEMYGR